MKPTERDFAMLRGAEFRSSYRFSLSCSDQTATRFDYILQRVAGKSVLHVGCADHAELLEKKMRDGTWLHGCITGVAARCLGVDVNEHAVAELNTRYGCDNVAVLDMFSQDERLAGWWDYIVLGEVLEHMDDPVGFLRRLRETYAGRAGAVIITVPNAFFYKNFKLALRGQEVINTDHRYWFTPYTLAKVLTVAGFEVRDVRSTQDSGLKFMPNFTWALLRHVPLLRSNVVATAAFETGR